MRTKFTFRSPQSGISVPVVADSFEEAIQKAQKADPSVTEDHLVSNQDGFRVSPRDGRKLETDNQKTRIPSRSGRSASHVSGQEVKSPEKPRRLIPDRNNRNASWFK